MVAWSEVEEDIEVREVEMIMEIRYELCCYHWVYIYLHFTKDNGVEKKEKKVGVEPVI